MADRWTGAFTLTGAYATDHIGAADLIVDALFGAGLSRPLAGAAAALVAAINSSGHPVVAVDVPSGLDGTTGQPTGPVVRATETVTFFRLKPGHVLQPGRQLCGHLTLADIGIPSSVLDDIAPQLFRNAPSLWRDLLPTPQPGQHKYTRGHVLVLSGPATATGAARLSARAALRAGAGLVTMGASGGALAVLATQLTAVMISDIGSPKALAAALDDRRKNAVVIGPGAGVGTETAEMVLAALASPAALVLDADALTSFAGAATVEATGFGFTARPSIAEDATPETLFTAIARRAASTVLTPHEGEFGRLFGDLPGSKFERAAAAAKRSSAVVILKGADTVIAAPDGRAAINADAPPSLATAGSGDVLAGIVASLLAQGMPAFEAACAAVWLHGRAATSAGAGLISEDLPEHLPQAFAAVS
jgi:NAD(P)H-hydrate epimerase